MTVRRWISSGGLPIIDDCKPTLILGTELAAYVKGRRSPKHKCRLDQCYCMRCREPKAAALAEAELIQTRSASAMVRMLCETCATVMHKRISWKQIPQLSTLVSLSGVQHVKHLSEITQPCVNDHSHKEV